MQKLITNSNTNNNQIPTQPQTTRIYSFQQKNDQLSVSKSKTSQQLYDFIKDVHMIEHMHKIVPNMGNMLMINSSDVTTVQQALHDSSLSKQIKDRMSKYLKVVDYVTFGDIPEKLPQFAKVQQFEANKTNKLVSNNLGQQTQKIKLSISLKQIQQTSAQKQSPAGQMPSYMQPTLLSTSRYINNQQKFNRSQQKISSQNKIKAELSNKNIQSKSPKIKNKNQISNMNSRLKASRYSSSSQSQSKHFHKIQLKSVKRLGTTESQLNNSRLKDAQMKRNQQKNEKQMKKQKEQQNRRYVISHRNQQKNKQKINTQDPKNSTSRIKINKKPPLNSNLQKSRFSSSSFSKSHRQIKQVNKKIEEGLSPNRHLQRCCNDSRIRQKSITRQKDNITQVQIEVRNETNLAYQTVQKSTDFLLMLRMMSEQ